MTKVQAPRTRNRVTDSELLLVSPKTGLLVQVELTRPAEPQLQESFDATIKTLQDIVDHLNKTIDQT
jgi:hypothetical protein